MEELIGNPKYISDIETKENIPIIKFTPGYDGADFTSQNPEIVIKITPGNELKINKLQLPKTDSNVQTVEVILKKLDGSQPEKITITEPNQIVYPTSSEISQIVVKILETTDGEPPRNVVISVQSCSEEATTTVTTPGSTSQSTVPESSVTSTTPGLTTTTPKGSSSFLFFVTFIDFLCYT